MERGIDMETNETEAKKYKCSKCKHGRFRTVKKENGIRKQVRCRQCGHVQEVAVVEVQNVVADKVPEVQDVVVPV